MNHVAGQVCLNINLERVLSLSHVKKLMLITRLTRHRKNTILTLLLLTKIRKVAPNLVLRKKAMVLNQTSQKSFSSISFTVKIENGDI